MRTPERRTLTGWRWRISEPRTARTRLRFVFGMPIRKTDFQIWELTMPSCKALRSAIAPLETLSALGSQLSALGSRLSALRVGRAREPRADSRELHTFTNDSGSVHSPRS